MVRPFLVLRGTGLTRSVAGTPPVACPSGPLTGCTDSQPQLEVESYVNLWYWCRLTGHKVNTLARSTTRRHPVTGRVGHVTRRRRHGNGAVERARAPPARPATSPRTRRWRARGAPPGPPAGEQHHRAARRPRPRRRRRAARARGGRRCPRPGRRRTTPPGAGIEPVPVSSGRSAGGSGASARTRPSPSTHRDPVRGPPHPRGRHPLRDPDRQLARQVALDRRGGDPRAGASTRRAAAPRSTNTSASPVLTPAASSTVAAGVCAAPRTTMSSTSRSGDRSTSQPASATAASAPTTTRNRSRRRPSARVDGDAPLPHPRVDSRPGRWAGRPPVGADAHRAVPAPTCELGLELDTRRPPAPAPAPRATSSRTSPAVAPASAWKKLACFAETTAPPTRSPLSPGASMRRPAESPGGLRNTEPALAPPGWCSRRQRTISATRCLARARDVGGDRELGRGHDVVAASAERR